MTIYHPPLWSRVFTRVVFGAMIAADVALAAGILYAPDMGICLGVMIVWGLLPVLVYANLYPSIGISGDHLIVCTIWGTRKSIAWKDILEVRPMRKYALVQKWVGPQLMVKAKHLGLLYRIYGLMYDRGGQGILIHPRIGKNVEFMATLGQKCPHAFKKGSVS